MPNQTPTALARFGFVISGMLAALGAGAQQPMEVVVVTTGFRPQNLSDYPGSAVVIDSALIRSRDAKHLESVVTSAANITMTSGASRGRFVQVRGVGDLEQFVDPKHYPSVGISIDGIDVGGIASAAMLFDIDRVELMRGPQGTTYGSGALAGQINLYSTSPGTDFEAEVEAGLADYGAATFGFAGGGALTDDIGGRVSVSRHQGDGYISNAWLGRDDTNGYEETMVRGRLEWQPGDDASVGISVVRFDSTNGYDAFSLDNTRTTLSDQPGHDDLELSALGLNGRFDVGTAGTIEARVSLLDSKVDYAYDEDWTYVGICDGVLCDPVYDYFSNTDRYIRERQDKSVDVRWLSTQSGDTRRPDFVLGVYLHDRSEDLTREYYGSFSSGYSTDRIAIYAQLDLPLSERADLIIGTRHEQFEDDYVDSFAFTSESADDLSTGQIAFRYALDDRTSVYASVSKGARPGGVNTEASSVLPLVQQRFQDFLATRLMFRREGLLNTEVGFRSLLEGGRLLLSGSLFRMSRDDAQLESWFWDPVNYLWVGALDNADGDNTGIEFDLDYQSEGRWRLTASLGLLDTEVDSITTFDLNADDFVIRSGIDQAKAPSWQLFVSNEWQLANDWLLNFDIESTDSQRYGYYHDGEIGQSTLFNASLIRSIGATEIQLWARNLLDEDVAVHGLYFGNDPRKGWVPERYLQFDEPRLVGVTVRHSF